MSLPQNSIGPFNFMALLGAVQTADLELIVDSRPGVEDLEFTNTLGRGRPFTLRSRVDVPTREFGLYYFHDEYKRTPGVGPLDLVQSDFDWTTLDQQVVVLRVALASCYRCRAIVGGLSAGSTAILEADWDLVMVKLRT